MENNNRDILDNRFRLAASIAGVAGVLAIIVCALLAYDYSRRLTKDPLQSATYDALRNTLAQQPTNEAIKKQIRAIDLELRREYFRQKTFAEVGAIFLLVSFGVFLLAGKTAVTLHRQLPRPEPLVTLEDIETKWTRLARYGVCGLMALLVIGVLALNFTARSPLPGSIEALTAMLGEPKANAEGNNSAGNNTRNTDSSADSTNKKAGGEAAPSDDEIAHAWPTFRGPGGRGISAFENVPTEWSAVAGKEKNLRWKTAVPLQGNGSPVVWKDKVFLSGGDENRREVYCFEAKSGKILWQKPVVTPQSNAKMERPPDAGYASSTVATDGRRVYSLFANGDLAAFEMNGNLAWSKNLGLPDSIYGFASSPTVYKNRVIVQYDQGSEKDGKSKIFAFDSATGNVVWQMARKVPNSWSSPIVIRAADRDQIVAAANPWVIAYDPQDGKEIWKANCLPGEIGASPTFAAGKVFTANEGANLSAIPADGQGDVTAKILWKGEDGIPDTCSPLANEQFVLLLSADGTLTCYDAEKGDKLWEESFDEGGSSSPSLVGNRVFVFANSGKGWVVEISKEKCRRIAENELGEESVTCPAFQDGCFYIRGKDSLFCIGAK